MNNIICIAGPTASGKTALAVELAKELHGEVVSCDSMQVYKRMDIGTAKKDDSIALWNYVQTGLENMTEYTLVDWEGSGLQEGMTVITTGNVNLAHEAPVKIIE